MIFSSYIPKVTKVADEMFMKNRSAELHPADIKDYNRMVLEGLELKEGITIGEYRTHQVRISGVGYLGAPPEDLDLLMEETCNWLNGFAAPEHLQVAIGIIKAIIAHVYIAWIHPFGDGNGRTARIIETQILLSYGLPMPTAHLLSNHYNETRSEYYRYLEISSQRDNGIYDFVAYALQGFIDQLKLQVQYVKQKQLEVHWKSYVYDQFRNKDGATDTRRRRLVLDLSSKAEPVPLSEVRYVSSRIAEAYADKTLKTVQRDVNRLEKMGLIVKTKEGIVANRGIMQAFLPQKRDAATSE